MHCDVAIVGGGMGGLIAAGWLRVHRPDLCVLLIEPGNLGQSLQGGGLKYLRWNEELEQLLEDLGHVHAKIPVNGGILDKAGTEPVPYPDGVPLGMLDAVQRRHYLMTRGTMDGFTPDVMNFGGKDSFRLETAPGLVASLAGGVDGVIETFVTTIHPSESSAYLRLAHGPLIEAKTTIWTAPLIHLAKAMKETRITDSLLRAKTLNVMECFSREEDVWWDAYDYVYTSMISDSVHRASYSESGHIQVEWNGENGITPAVLQDLERLSLTPILATGKTLPGHLLPLGDIQRHIVEGWEVHGIRPMGRFAEWNGRATVDHNVSKTRELFSV